MLIKRLRGKISELQQPKAVSTRSQAAIVKEQVPTHDLICSNVKVEVLIIWFSTLNHTFSNTVLWKLVNNCYLTCCR